MFKVLKMLSAIALTLTTVLVALASADLWISSMSPDEISEMGLEL
jgi:hypothetical protein